jgi:hypothetical protein
MAAGDDRGLVGISRSGSAVLDAPGSPEVAALSQPWAILFRRLISVSAVRRRVGLASAAA